MSGHRQSPAAFRCAHRPGKPPFARASGPFFFILQARGPPRPASRVPTTGIRVMIISHLTFRTGPPAGLLRPRRRPMGSSGRPGRARAGRILRRVLTARSPASLRWRGQPDQAERPPALRCTAAAGQRTGQAARPADHHDSPGPRRPRAAYRTAMRRWVRVVSESVKQQNSRCRCCCYS